MNVRWPRRYIRLIAHAIRQMMSDETEASRAKRRFLDRIRKTPDRGTKGRIGWTRDESHER